MISLEQGQKTPSHVALISKLVDFRYVRVAMVMVPGEFSVRGMIIDVFPVNHTFPVRIDFFGDEIDRITSFNPQTQRSFSDLKKTSIDKAPLHKDPWQFSVRFDDTAQEVLSTIQPGDYVVHETYGVGQFQGLFHLSFGNREGEFAFLKYKGDDKVYVPLEQMALIKAYRGTLEHPPLSGLNDGHWTKTKARVAKAAAEFVSEVYYLHKLRETQKGFAFGPDTETQIEFEHGFAFQETPDQHRALTEIKSDMEAVSPMDRVLCGDVGFGKTEVFLRAAFKALNNGKQVAILVPTTILVSQHVSLFQNRLSKFGYDIAGFSRMVSSKDVKVQLAGLKMGLLRIAVGTHRLLQKDVAFHDLGLLIIDEEHRFGVNHKETLKKKFPTVDILSVSATPIPRTLYMALTGTKALSTLETPPKKRKPVFTQVLPFDPDKVKKVIQAELDRGGQVFYLSNHVKGIERKAVFLNRLLPGVEVGIGHGQLSETQLHRVMTDFVSKKIKILICTTIIENGLDIPNANTIIVEDAEHFGLSQIHQIRGRVGRSETQGFCYLFYSAKEVLSDVAERRLKAIKEYSGLGAGKKIALRDLEIRGAGTVLGHKQHGYMNQVGFDLYCELIEAAKNKLEGRPSSKKKELFIPPSIKAYIPDDYVENPRERLALYQRVMSAETQDALDDIAYEMKDRYGEFPKIVTILFKNIRVQLTG